MRELHDVISATTGGIPTSYPDYQERLPSIMWHFDNCDIHLSPSCRYAPQERAPGTHRWSRPVLREVRLTLTFTHEPNGFDELKREAAAIRAAEGRGAEVDYVAWGDAL